MRKQWIPGPDLKGLGTRLPATTASGPATSVAATRQGGE